MCMYVYIVISVAKSFQGLLEFSVGNNGIQKQVKEGKFIHVPGSLDILCWLVIIS